MIRQGVSAGLVDKHGVNLAQNLGVWFWGPEPKLQKKKVKEFLRLSKLRARGRYSQKIKKENLILGKILSSPEIDDPSPLQSFWHVVGHLGHG